MKTHTVSNQETDTGGKIPTQMLMRYVDQDGNLHTRLISMGKSENIEDLIRTARWASYQGIEIKLTPV